MNATLKILITDDEEGMRLGTARALGSYVARFPDIETDVSYAVETATTGEEALEKIVASLPDILLLDYKLPGMSGLDLLVWISEHRPDLLTVMITAYASLETAIAATKQGAFDFLAKPFTPEELRASVRKATQHLMLQRRARELSEEKRRVRFEFISVLAHELKAPLNAIEGYLNLLSETDTIELDTLRHVVSRSRIRLQGMRKLIFDLLDMTRIEAGTKQRDIQDVDLAVIARASIETLEPDAASRGIRMELIADGPQPFCGDPAELEIVFNNLVSNAVKYNRDGGEVRVVIGRTGEESEIAVSDTGIGMSVEEMLNLFKDFVRIKNAKTRTILGSGLGLSTVKKIAKLYEGDVVVASEPDAGSTFTVTLRPAAKDVAPQRTA